MTEIFIRKKGEGGELYWRGYLQLSLYKTKELLKTVRSGKQLWTPYAPLQGTERTRWYMTYILRLELAAIKIFLYEHNYSVSYRFWVFFSQCLWLYIFQENANIGDYVLCKGYKQECFSANDMSYARYSENSEFLTKVKPMALQTRVRTAEIYCNGREGCKSQKHCSTDIP